MSFPVIANYTIKAPIAGAATLSDMMFLAVKDYNEGGTSKILEDSGNRTTTGVLCEVDVPNLKTFYLAYANAWVTDAAAGSDYAEIALQEDNTATDTQVGEIKWIGMVASTNDNLNQQGQVSGADLFKEFKGKLIFSNTSGSAKKVKLRVSTIANATVRGTIIGWTEDNGTSPAI